MATRTPSAFLLIATTRRRLPWLAGFLVACPWTAWGEQPFALQPGDRVAVTVWEFENLSGQRTIRPDGKLSLPLVGEVSAAGLTPKQLEDALAGKLKEYLIAPHVSVDAERSEPEGITVYIAGGVQKPGAYKLAQGSRLLQAVTNAGGATKQADRRRASLMRAGSAPRTVDLEAVERGEATHNLALEDGDVLVVPTVRQTVSILGAVQQPGTVEVLGEVTVLEALGRAEGAREDADLAGAHLIRHAGPAEPLDLAALLREGEMGHNVLLQPGDALFVPAARRTRLTIVGSVKSPGVFTLLEPVTYAEALALAGGANPEADLARVVHTRKDGASDEVDVARRLENPVLGGPKPVGAGDVLFVPVSRAAVSVVGQVDQPGSYPLAPGQRVLDALTRAGGLLEEAEPAAATLTRRDGSVEPLALADLLEHGDLASNVLLQPGDVIAVPRRGNRVYVFGDVKDPGRHRLGDQHSLLGALHAAGGAERDADLGRVVIVRQEGATEPEVLAADLGALVNRGDVAQDRELRDGDIVFVPQRKQRFEIRDVLNYLFGLDLLRRISRRN